MNWAKANWVTLVNVALGFINLALLYVLLFPTMIQLDMWRGLSVYNAYHKDALQAAISLGRLDLISILLTVLGVILGLFALVSFAYFKYGAEEVARDAARQVAEQVAKSTANEVARNAIPGPPPIVAREKAMQQDVQEFQDMGTIDLRNKENEDETGGGNDDVGRTDGGR